LYGNINSLFPTGSIKTNHLHQVDGKPELITHTNYFQICRSDVYNTTNSGETLNFSQNLAEELVIQICLLGLICEWGGENLVTS
jgi:hypothetical protein